jgi:hypothetical protein
MAPERRSQLIQWLSLGLTALIILASVVFAFSDVQTRVHSVEQSDRAQWRQINEGRAQSDMILERLEEIRYNQRRDMEDRGVRYIERGR